MAKKIAEADLNHPVLNPTTKFSVGEEVIYAPGKTGKIMGMAGDKYIVAHHATTNFGEGALKKVGK